MPHPTRRTPRGGGERRQIGVRFDKPVADDGVREADRRGISFNKLVNMAVRDWLDGRSSRDRPL